MYPAPFCYQIMTLIDKIVHYLIFYFDKFCFKVDVFKQKSDTILHNIHPGLLDPYIWWTMIKGFFLRYRSHIWSYLQATIVSVAHFKACLYPGLCHSLTDSQELAPLKAFL